MASKSSVVAEACQAMENKCAAFLEALKTCSKEAAKVGSGMKAKYLELTQNVAAYVKTLTKGADAKALGNFPSKLACCTMLDGITFVNNKTKPLVAHTAAIQQLFGIIEFLYLRSAMRAGREEPVRIGMDNNELYIYVDMLFKVFETIAKLQKVDETVYLRTVQTVLQTFSQSSPIMVYEDILRRSFLFLDAMLKVEGKVVRPIVEGGVRQLMQCLLASPVKAKEAGGNVAKRLPSSAGATGPGSGHTASLATPPIMHIELILEVVSCLCSITRGEALSFMQNLKPESAAEVLVITVTAMPKGVLFQVPKLHALAKDELHSTVKYMLADGALLSSGCTTLAKILDHGFYYSNHCEEADRGAVRLFLALFNFVELELVDASTAEGLQRRIVWMKGLVAIMQSDDLLDDMHRQSTRRLLVDMVKFTVKQLRMVKENNLDKFFENMYKCGEGQQLISEQIDRLEEGQQRRGGAKMLPIFAVRLDPDSCAMDFCNMTHGVIGKTARISVADATDRPHLEAVEAALAVDGVLAAVHVLYSCVVSANCEKPLFAPYRIFYPKVAGSDPTPAGPQHVGSGDAASGSDSEGCRGGGDSARAAATDAGRHALGGDAGVADRSDAGAAGGLQRVRVEAAVRALRRGAHGVPGAGRASVRDGLPQVRHGDLVALPAARPLPELDDAQLRALSGGRGVGELHGAPADLRLHLAATGGGHQRAPQGAGGGGRGGARLRGARGVRDALWLPHRHTAAGQVALRGGRGLRRRGEEKGAAGEQAGGDAADAGRVAGGVRADDREREPDVAEFAERALAGAGPGERAGEGGPGVFAQPLRDANGPAVRAAAQRGDAADGGGDVAGAGRGRDRAHDPDHLREHREPVPLGAGGERALDRRGGLRALQDAARQRRPRHGRHQRAQDGLHDRAADFGAERGHHQLPRVRYEARGRGGQRGRDADADRRLRGAGGELGGVPAGRGVPALRRGHLRALAERLQRRQQLGVPRGGAGARVRGEDGRGEPLLRGGARGAGRRGGDVGVHIPGAAGAGALGAGGGAAVRHQVAGALRQGAAEPV
ncbi:uncharacterized protein BcabD6B2_24040 [Babesia caballi]|uniref:Uncharacterized protein n=1 Tax=Babesia caballi TaxID=5871 RepID=A0AAV4LWX9_BABCB|nr:hypothetical protein, conserved [Babesia caballi]